ncbi:MAG: glycosyltransferase family 39 protein, partial [Acetobacteraceae bacterium]|nr:glycosyltransferase family 39 protein [Acetobacteraceae bacterium]
FYAHTGLGFLWTEGLRLEPTPPLYYTLILLWERLAGESAWALRLPSLAGSLLSVWLAYLLARELFDRRLTALFAAALLALAPTNIFYAQEARSYALQGAALTLALLGFARLLRDPRSGGALAMYAAGAVLAVYLHMTSTLAVASINAAALTAALGRRPLLDRAGLLRWIAANAGVTLACLPLLPIVLSPLTGAASAWVPKLDRWSLESVLGSTLAGPSLGRQAMVLMEIGVVLLAALVLLPPWRPGRRALTVLILVPGVFLALMIGISLVRPILLSRTLAWLLMPLAVVLGDVLARRLKLFALMVFGLSAVGAAIYLGDVDKAKEDWHGFLARLPDLGPPTLVVLAPATSPAAIAVYAPHAGETVRMPAEGLPTVETTIIPPMFGTKTISAVELHAAIASGRPVWLIYRRPEYDWMRKITADLPPPREAVQEGDGANPAMRALRW